ncbi:PilC/PilY family type IV pilus protein [Ramlibacter algicola]|uniref:PilY1 beta-propeller domain-containing protein n=1 Tax=Ramlibacter algicola TaxID=2795217 RepID=A0A934URW4_9BURK|nr:PilC/PilY family type IV pilus protein [Ramlibacter algicola]MBK0392947.1 hypothetical protein [Ramlibacter algicola]
MKRMQWVLALMALLLAGYSASLRAEDTDIYVDNSGTSGTPNVLFILDNGANFDATASGPGCSAYSGTSTPPSLGSQKSAGMLQCALVDAINSLPDGSVNIGLMVSNGNGYATSSPAATTNAYHELCAASGGGGCLLRKLTPMTTATNPTYGKSNKQSMIDFIKSWNATGNNNGPNDFSVKVNTASQSADAVMQEAWAYFNGKTGLSGTTYSPSQLTGCQRNFIIYIANTDKSPSNGNPSPGPDGASNNWSMADTRVNASDSQKGKITTAAAFNPAMCGITSVVATSSSGDWSTNWADEWARLMFQQDAGTNSPTGQSNGLQNIITYTIGMQGTCGANYKADYPALLSSMATYGGGKFFPTSDASGLTEALLKILNEVQAVNSVFSSASLPVSVNAQGTYLNQIFLGMFRPDAEGNPRWMGNLKQYKLVTGTNGALVMGDARGQAAISSAGTGFLSPSAESYWTYKDTTTAPDDTATGGFFVNDLKGATPTAFDLPDGEVVEKGGVAQQLRKENLRATFAGAMAATTNPRRLYTYCPAGGTCDPNLTNGGNEFSTANSAIAANAFGADNSVRINSIVRTGTTALVTTQGNHGFTAGSVVTIRNVNQAAYNVTRTLTAANINSSNSFTITGLPDTPKTPAVGTYVLSKPGVASFGLASITRPACSTSGCATSTELATVVTSIPHSFANGDSVQFSSTIAGYSSPVVIGNVANGTNTGSFTISLTLSPPAGAGATGTLAYPSSTATAISGNMSGSGTTVTATTAGHTFHDQQSVTITGSKGVDGTYRITRINSTQFSFTASFNNSNDLKPATNGGTTYASVATTPQTVNLQRMNNAASATIQASNLPANYFTSGDVLNVTSASAGFVPTSGSATISCNGSCTTATYTVSLPPAAAIIPDGTTVSVGGASITASSVSRSATGTVTVVVPSNSLVTGDTVTIAPLNGTGYTDESEYAGSYAVTCTVNPGCTTLTYGPIPLNPTTPATGANMQAYSATSSPDRDTVIKWVRGLDNQGDEKGPGNGIKVRESIHGDVLHSRPLVINYGDSRGIVAFYGANDGVFRAINGNQAGRIGSVDPGGELWGLVLPEHYPYLNRLRTNSPELQFPSTVLKTALPKNYFVDGPTGVYQKLTATGSIETAYIYLTMRRGGRFLYALDITQPQSPQVLWRIDTNSTGFEELGQTWSRPRLTLLQNYANPVLVFGGGYDPAHDTEPAGTAAMGRAIYIVDAVSGALVWRAQPSCGASGTCRAVPGMTQPIPSDIAFVDRDNNGKVDKLYVGDLGGNVWRVDVNTADTATWAVSKVASLGCDDGVAAASLCSDGKPVRKFFFPPSVLSIKAAGATGSYDALSLASGDREHPLKNTAAGSSYNTVDRFFLVRDTGTALGSPMASPLKLSDLFNATSTTWDGTRSGVYITLATGEKAVNAPLAVNGTVFFATNKPVDTTATCAANLGEARAYGVNPFDGTFVSNVLQGGGMPPSAVAGIVQMTKDNGNGGTTTYNEKFCIGCGISGSQLGGTNNNPCNSALENCNVGKVIPKNLRRTYWYKK